MYSILFFRNSGPLEVRFAQFPEIGGFETWLSSNGLVPATHAVQSTAFFFRNYSSAVSCMCTYRIGLMIGLPTLPPDPYRLIFR